MKRIFVFPSIEEAKSFILTGTKAPVFVTGGSAAETAACIVRAIRAKRPHQLVLAGFAPSLDGMLAPGTVVEVVTSCDRTGGEEHRYRTSGPDLGLPLAAGVVPGPETAGTETPGEEKTGEEKTGTKAAGTETPGAEPAEDCTEAEEECTETDRRGGAGEADEMDDAEEAEEEPLPEVASREGALFFALAEAFDIEASELRVIVGERGNGSSAGQERLSAGQLLAQTLQRLFDEQTPAEAPPTEA